MTKYHKNLVESASYASTIMKDVAGALANKNIQYVYSANYEEIVVDEKTKKEIKDLIRTDVDMPAMVLEILIGVTEAKGKVYIRLKKK